MTKIAGVVFYAAAGSRSVFPRLCGQYIGSTTNLLCVLLLVCLFFAKSLSLICCCWFLPKIAGVVFLSFGCVLSCCCLTRFCVCLCCACIVPGPQLICCVFFSFLPVFVVKSLALIYCFWFLHKIVGVVFLSCGCVLCCCWFTFAFAYGVWILCRASVHVLCACCSFSRFFLWQNES